MEIKIKNYDRVWAEINLEALKFNIESIKRKIKPDTKIIAVIKADGYGHGSLPIARVLEDEKRVWGYAVATAEEAFYLRDNNITKPILILGYAFSYSYEEFILKEIRPAVFTYEMALELSKKAQELGKTCKIHIKLDTGMTRIGICPVDEGLKLIKMIAALPKIEIEGIFTHFATADEADKTKTYIQLEKFKNFADRVENELGINIALKHCSNSAGIAEIPEANMDAVRAGIILYGLWPSNEVKKAHNIDLRPMLSLKSKVVYVKTVPEGTQISYGGTFTTKRQTRVATICIGYGDGYPRGLSNKGYVIIKGHKVPIVGRVCMDQFMVDVTDIGEPVIVGDTVTLIGKDGDNIITMEELGDLSGRFNYELACDLGKRIPRIYE
jgi:alanine racemase